MKRLVCFGIMFKNTIPYFETKLQLEYAKPNLLNKLILNTELHNVF